MNPAPTLLSEWITPTGFGIIVAILLIVAVIVVVTENLRDRREDTQDDTPAPYDDTCGIDGCTRRCTTLFYSATGVLFVCRSCAGRVSEWTGPAVFDQELDPVTDLSRWDKEMDAS